MKISSIDFAKLGAGILTLLFMFFGLIQWPTGVVLLLLCNQFEKRW